MWMLRKFGCLLGCFVIRLIFEQSEFNIGHMGSGRSGSVSRLEADIKPYSSPITIYSSHGFSCLLPK